MRLRVIGSVQNIATTFALCAISVCILSLIARANDSELSHSKRTEAVSFVLDLARQCSSAHDLYMAPEIRRLTLAYVAVESLARPKWRQLIELKIAEYSERMSLISPAHTIGVSQISHETFEKEQVRLWLSKHLNVDFSDMPFWKIMSDNCFSVFSAYHMVSNFTKYSESKPKSISALLDHLHGTSNSNAAARESRFIYDFLYRQVLALLAAT